VAALQVALHVADLLEVVEHARLRLRRNADAAVAHLHAPGEALAAPPVRCAHRQQHPPARRELDGVVHQVGQHAAQRHGVGPDHRAAGQRTRTRLSPAWRASSCSSGASATAAGRSGSTAASMRPISSSWLVSPSSACCARASEPTVCCTACMSAPLSQLLAQHLGLQADGHHGLAQVVVGGREKAQPLGLGLFGGAQAGQGLFAQRALVERRPMFSSSWCDRSATSFHIIAVRPMPMTDTAIITGAPSQMPVTMIGASSSVIASCVAGV
jgi:hypothetical protein